jgi:enoyl-CoA hydratase
VPPGLPSFEAISLERDGPITWLTLNRPEKLNALNGLLLEELSEALSALSDDAQTVVVIIRGAGRAFSAGYDIERADSGEAHFSVDIVDDYAAHLRHIERFMQIWDLPKPVIASVHGYCLAGATQLCVFCDITVVAEDAVIGLPSIPLGGGYITPLWVPLVGPKRAKQMSFVAGSKISGTTASDWGWANYAVPAAELEANVRDLALEIAKIPPPILRMKKKAINRAADLMGFRNIAPLGAETDALLHYSESVTELAAWIQSDGLKGAIARFQSTGLAGEDKPPAGGADG